MVSAIIINFIIGKSSCCSICCSVCSFSLVFSLLHLNHSEIELSKSSFSPNRYGNDSRTLIRGTDYFSQSYLPVCRFSGQWFNCIDTGKERGWGEAERMGAGIEGTKASGRWIRGWWTARWTDRSEREQERIVEWNDWKSGGSLIGLRVDGSVVATHARVVYATCQGLRGVKGGWRSGGQARGWRGDGWVWTSVQIRHYENTNVLLNQYHHRIVGTGEGGTFATREYAGDEREWERKRERERVSKRERQRQRRESGTDGTAEGVIRE